VEWGRSESASAKKRDRVCVSVCVIVCVCMRECACVCARVYVFIRQQLLGLNLVSFVNILSSLQSLSLSPHSTPPPPLLETSSPTQCAHASRSLSLRLSLHSLSLSFNGIILSISLCLPPTYRLLLFVENTPTLLPELAIITRFPPLCR